MQISLKNTNFMNRAISELKKGLNKKELDKVGDIAGKWLGTFAPEDTGALKNAYKKVITKNAVAISWGNSGKPADKYAHYQYVGVAMEPVRPVFENSLWTDKWRTPKGTHKVYAKDRHFIGTPHTVVYDNGKVAFVKGYTKPESSAHWIDEARETPEIYNKMRREMYEHLAVATGKRIVGKRYFIHNGFD